VAKTTGGRYIVTPDNGTLTHIKALEGIEEIREIDEKLNRRPGTGKMNTFHGRDIFAYTAGRLAAGIIGFPEVGPAYPLEEIQSFPLENPEIREGAIQGIITMADHHFGNAYTNIGTPEFEGLGLGYGDQVKITITRGEREVFSSKVLYHRSFGFVGLREPILYNGSTGYMILGLNGASMVDAYALEAGNDWKILLERPRI
jgi:S-adenosylmethionine hydrolase